MGTLRSFAYDDPNYKLVRTFTSTSGDVASATDFAKFRSRAAVVISHAILEVMSVASVAKVVFTLNRNASVNTTFTLASCTTVGNITQVAVDITLLSAGDVLSVQHDDTGDYRIIYEYQILPGESLYHK